MLRLVVPSSSPEHLVIAPQVAATVVTASADNDHLEVEKDRPWAIKILAANLPSCLLASRAYSCASCRTRLSPDRANRYSRNNSEPPRLKRR